ncbi:DUF4127 family protein [Paenibacillus senegalensis]|uniref:DUF4127 family protein n=1 Tax=Paenibacillus senegalensis TaxID=1465766 RepID=UPI0002893FD2|nr:DUF4127 family protein [Paenibacillus senegalensis]
MKPIVLLPLDERPCNVNYVEQLAQLGQLPLSVPPRSAMGNKKQPGDVTRLAEWLEQEAKNASSLILSIDMLIYGGIVPSRLHHLSKEECAQRLALLRKIKQERPDLTIYAFNLIMRTPQYSSSDEEPDYYAEYGRSIFRYSWLLDKQEQEPLNAEELAEWEDVLRIIPEDVLSEHLQRRSINAYVNELTIQLAHEGIIDFLIIPLDDNSEYGFSPMEQRKLLFLTEELGVMDRVHLYPGADEIGCTLLARVFCQLHNYVPEVYVRYSSTRGPQTIPNYEDRSLNESIKSHLTAAGAYAADASADCDFVLMVHSPPGGQMAESVHTFRERNRLYHSEVHYNEFVQAIARYIRKGYPVAVADVANSNGSDHTFMKLLAKSGLLPSLAAYAAWNTSGNTLGTVIAHGIIESYFRKAEGSVKDHERFKKSREFYVSRLIEDWGYQTLVRKDIKDHHLEALGGNYFDVAGPYEEVTALVRQKLIEFTRTYLDTLRPDTIQLDEVYMPWKRMFEVGIKVSLRDQHFES